MALGLEERTFIVLEIFLHLRQGYSSLKRKRDMYTFWCLEPNSKPDIQFLSLGGALRVCGCVERLWVEVLGTAM